MRFMKLVHVPYSFFLINVCVITVILSVLTGRTLGTETIRLTNGHWPPYLSEELPHKGFASHIVSEAFMAVGIRTEYGFFPWKRSYAYALNGTDSLGETWHGTLVWVYTETRSESFHYSDPVLTDIEVLYHLKSNPLTWESVEDLQGLIIGGTLHTAYPVFEEAERKGILKIDRGGNYDILFRKLLYRGIDAIPQVRHVGNYYLMKTLTPDEQNKITFSPTIIQERRYHLILTKKNPGNIRFMNLFNKGLQKIKTNGRYETLYKNLEKGQYNDK